jgi:hypothetical protein
VEYMETLEMILSAAKHKRHITIKCRNGETQRIEDHSPDVRAPIELSVPMPKNPQDKQLYDLVVSRLKQIDSSLRFRAQCHISGWITDRADYLEGDVPQRSA